MEDAKASPVAATIECTVNGVTGDVMIHGIEAKTGATTIHALGSVQGSPQGSPKATNLDLDVKDGRAEDLLGLFMHDDVPVTGPVWIHAHAYLEPSGNGAEFLQRLHVKGGFEVPRERLSDRQTEASLTAFSERAQGRKVPDPEKGAASSEHAAADALLLQGTAEIRNAVVSSPRLTFRVPGAEADLGGTFNLHSKAVHLVGQLQHGNRHLSRGDGFPVVAVKAARALP